MTILDKYLQAVRIRKALKHIPKGASLLDIGCFKGELLQKASRKIFSGTGIDPNTENVVLSSKLRLIKGVFPAAEGLELPVDCITALAVFEHIPASLQPGFLKACYDALTPGGRLIFTIPDQKVDRILDQLVKLKLVHGMSIEEHHGFDAFDTIPMAVKAGFKLHLFEQFQMGLNNLFVFEKPAR